MAELAEKVDALIKAVGGPSYDKLAAAIRATGGPTISGTYIHQLRTGARHNPTFQNLQALSRYFTKALGIPVTLNYFDAETPVDQPWVDARNEGRVAELERQLERNGSSPHASPTAASGVSPLATATPTRPRSARSSLSSRH